LNQRLTRARRLTQKEEFNRAFSCGKKITHQGITAWLAPAAQPRLGFAISRKYGNNVRRNQFKRRARSAFRQLYDQLPAADIVITASAKQGWITYHDLEGFFRYIISNDQ